MISINLSDYFSFFDDYFVTQSILLGITFGLVALAVLFSIFRISKKSEPRSRALLSMIVVSASLWVFVLSSLAFCIVFLPDYLQAPEQTISLVARLALLSSLLIAPVGAFLLRGRAAREVSGFFFPRGVKIANDASRNVSDAKVGGRVSRIFSSLKQGLVSANVEIEVLPLNSGESAPYSAALDLHGKKVVAITENVAQSLDDDELQAVLAHELAHIKFKDAAKKTIATAYRLAFQFDPLSRLIEAAIYRERELAADEFSAKSTGKPAALASALLKIYGLGRLGEGYDSPSFSSLSLPGKTSGFLCKQPSLKLRIERLLRMSETPSLRAV